MKVYVAPVCITIAILIMLKELFSKSIGLFNILVRRMSLQIIQKLMHMMMLFQEGCSLEYQLIIWSRPERTADLIY